MGAGLGGRPCRLCCAAAALRLPGTRPKSAWAAAGSASSGEDGAAGADRLLAPHRCAPPRLWLGGSVLVAWLRSAWAARPALALDACPWRSRLGAFAHVARRRRGRRGRGRVVGRRGGGLAGFALAFDCAVLRRRDAAAFAGVVEVDQFVFVGGDELVAGGEEDVGAVWVERRGSWSRSSRARPEISATQPPSRSQLPTPWGSYS